MVFSVRVRPEEERAAVLLCEFLKTRRDVTAAWTPGADPPDFVFTVAGERWAVEVTRSDQRVPAADGTRSRGDADMKLVKFGQRVAQEFQPRVTRPYTLVLRPRAGVTDTTAWKKKVRRETGVVIGHARTGKFALDAEACAELEGYELMLMQALMKAVPDNAALLIVGDIDQLPSVGRTARAPIFELCREECRAGVRFEVCWGMNAVHARNGRERPMRRHYPGCS